MTDNQPVLEKDGFPADGSEPPGRRAKAKTEPENGGSRRAYLVFDFDDTAELNLTQVGTVVASSADQAIRKHLLDAHERNETKVPKRMCAIAASAIHTRTIEMERPEPRVKLTA